MIDRTYDLSLVICTRNRAAQLAQTLKRVLAIRSRLDWELIVSDNGSTDRTRAVVEEYAAACDRPVRLIYKPDRGVSRARNAGWQSAKSEIVAYIDDDCYPAEGYVDAVFDCFTKDPRLGFVGGRILLYDPSDLKITIQESSERLSFPPYSFIRPGAIHGANLAFRRVALSEVGGFDVWFGPGALFVAEELELLARISAAGWTGEYDPRPLVYHHHRRKTRGDEWRLRRTYDRGRGGYYAKCILNERMRQLYIRNWLLTRRNYSWKASALEIVAGLEYIARALLSGRSRC
ncbi:MAG TPA: glycosyltransferase family 2 protein [Chthoniobacterales bacterium]|nr:glycosyltransferase family 2 protein [Chthoniobacterales bacterium]